MQSRRQVPCYLVPVLIQLTDAAMKTLTLLFVLCALLASVNARYVTKEVANNEGKCLEYYREE